MTVWRHVSECDAPPPYVPPVDACVLLTTDGKGNVRPVERLKTPVDENGIPNPYETLRLLASTLDANYALPHPTNVHHQVHFRSEYQEPIEKTYRESPSLMMNMSVQMHNLNHLLLERAPKPSVATMEQYNREQRLISLLFKTGWAAVNSERAAHNLTEHLERHKAVDRVTTLESIANMSRRSRTKRKLFEKTLARQAASSIGLMPDADMLGEMGVAEATTYLGKIGGNQFLDFRRASQDFIIRYGIRTEQPAAELTGEYTEAA